MIPGRRRRRLPRPIYATGFRDSARALPLRSHLNEDGHIFDDGVTGPGRRERFPLQHTTTATPKVMPGSNWGCRRSGPSDVRLTFTANSPALGGGMPALAQPPHF